MGKLARPAKEQPQEILKDPKPMIVLAQKTKNIVLKIIVMMVKL